VRGAQRGVAVFEVQDAADTGNVDPGVDEGGDAQQAGEAIGAVAPRATVAARRGEQSVAVPIGAGTG
jgi:hypothetical protein